MYTFNLKQYIFSKQAKKQDNVVTEKQLREGKDSKEQDSLQEIQLESLRKDEKNPVLIEKKLSGNTEANKKQLVTEKQLRNGKDSKEQDSVHEVQLESSRKDEKNPVLIEKKLSKETCSCNVTSIKKEAKKEQDSVITEKQLRDGKDSKDQDSISEKQLECCRKDQESNPIEKNLDKVRKEASNVLTEGELDKSKSKLVTHRNQDAYTGNVPKLEEKRLANKPVEKQKYEAASKDDPKRAFPITKGKDGLETAVASNDFEVVWLKEANNSKKKHINTLAELSADEDELNLIEEDGLIDEFEAESEKYEDPLTLYQSTPVSSNEENIDPDVNQVYQYTFLFEPEKYREESSAKEEFARWLSGFFQIPFDEVNDRMIVNFSNGTVTLNIDK